MDGGRWLIETLRDLEDRIASNVMHGYGMFEPNRTPTASAADDHTLKTDPWWRYAMNCEELAKYVPHHCGIVDDHCMRSEHRYCFLCGRAAPHEPLTEE